MKTFTNFAEASRSLGFQTKADIAAAQDRKNKTTYRWGKELASSTGISLKKLGQRVAKKLTVKTVEKTVKTVSQPIAAASQEVSSVMLELSRAAVASFRKVTGAAYAVARRAFSKRDLRAEAEELVCSRIAEEGSAFQRGLGRMTALVKNRTIRVLRNLDRMISLDRMFI